MQEVVACLGEDFLLDGLSPEALLTLICERLFAVMRRWHEMPLAVQYAERRGPAIVSALLRRFNGPGLSYYTHTGAAKCALELCV